MHELYVALAVTGTLLLVLGLLTGLIHNAAYASEPLIALVAGVLIGPAALGWLNLSFIGDQEAILEQASLVTVRFSPYSRYLSRKLAHRVSFSYKPVCGPCTSYHEMYGLGAVCATE